MINPLEKLPRIEVKLEQGDVVFLCEGLDDCAVVHELTKGWKRQPKIGQCADHTSLAEEFKLLAKFANMLGLKAIGFMFDAETKREARLGELKKWYSGAGFAWPDREAVLCDTKLSNGGVVQTAYLIVPPGGGTGCLESLFIPQLQNSPIAECVDQVLACFASKAPTTGNELKRRLRIFLAHKNASNTSVKVGIEDENLRCDTPEFSAVSAFVDLVGGVTPHPTP